MSSSKSLANAHSYLIKEVGINEKRSAISIFDRDVVVWESTTTKENKSVNIMFVFNSIKSFPINSNRALIH